ncbi:hypothetical protein BS47DRAFT_1364743 [Hydnum rufescens UP504]|uniref:DUF4100 domain-containing protein n=1 Tax=Hydnum rufescens UP504 TaxID=1448309 RepID=A0A9P6DT61_9AGAM|nr:hypothetical protein BS47DRAFT_1364743 [Hydnum rufescens UP504]
MAEPRANPVAKSDKPEVRYTPMGERPHNKVSRLPKHQVTVKIPPRNVPCPVPETHPSPPQQPVVEIEVDDEHEIEKMRLQEAKKGPEKEPKPAYVPHFPPPPVISTPFLDARTKTPSADTQKPEEKHPQVVILQINHKPKEPFPKEQLPAEEKTKNVKFKNKIQQEDIEMEVDSPEKHLPKSGPAFKFTMEFQDACEDKEVVKKVLNQKIEISLGDFLGIVPGPAKLFAAGLKLKREPTNKYRDPLTVNSAAYKEGEISES